MSDPEAFQPLRDVIAATAADLSNGNPFWTAGQIAAVPPQFWADLSVTLERNFVALARGEFDAPAVMQ